MKKTNWKFIRILFIIALLMPVIWILNNYIFKEIDSAMNFWIIVLEILSITGIVVEYKIGGLTNQDDSDDED